MLPTVPGAEPIVTASVCRDELPQLLLAFTVTMPPFEPAVATMLLVVDEPVQPNGNVHVYEVAPLIGVT